MFRQTGDFTWVNIVWLFSEVQIFLLVWPDVHNEVMEFHLFKRKGYRIFNNTWTSSFPPCTPTRTQSNFMSETEWTVALIGMIALFGRYLIASHTTDYQRPMLFLNTIAVTVLVVAKLPNMHKVRIFGINAGSWAAGSHGTQIYTVCFIWITGCVAPSSKLLCQSTSE